MTDVIDLKSYKPKSLNEDEKIMIEIKNKIATIQDYELRCQLMANFKYVCLPYLAKGLGLSS